MFLNKDIEIMETKIVIYEDVNGEIKLDVSLENDTLWLSQKQLEVLFDRDKSVISRHIKNIFKEEDKNDFMQSIYSLMGVVLDDNSEMATFLTPIVRGINSVTYRELKNVGGKKDVDVTELLGVLVKSKMLG